MQLKDKWRNLIKFQHLRRGEAESAPFRAPRAIGEKGAKRKKRDAELDRRVTWDPQIYVHERKIPTTPPWFGESRKNMLDWRRGSLCRSLSHPALLMYSDLDPFLNPEPRILNPEP